MYSGIYRNEFILEPAIAAILAGELKLNEEITSPAGAKTFAFDVFNGANGLLHACYMAVQFIRTKKYRNSMIVTAEIENNADIPSKELRGLQETSSALVLDESKSGNSGFGNFVFKNYTNIWMPLLLMLNWKEDKPICILTLTQIQKIIISTVSLKP